MTIDLYDPEEVVDVAIARESFSAELYTEAGKIVVDPESRRIIERMHNEELRHRKLLEEARRSGELRRIGKPPISGKLAKINVPNDLHVDRNSSPREILLFALGREERAVDYYSRYIDAFHGTSLGELFARLKSEEETHREQIEIMLNKL